MTPSLLGFDIQNSQDAIQRREAAYKLVGNNPRSLPAFADADIPVLLGLGILYRRRDGSLARHPLLPTTNEDIIQFFRWAVGTDKHPLPPLVRRILCVKRDILQESIESMYTTPFLRTGERKMLSQIELLLKNDGVKDLDAACEGREPLAVLGAWAQPTLTVDLGALKGPSCDYTSLQAQLERLGDTLATLEPSDTVKQEVLALLDQLLSVLGSTESALVKPPTLLKDQFKSLRKSIQAAKATLEQADAGQVKKVLTRVAGDFKNQVVALGQAVRLAQKQDKETESKRAELEKQLAEALKRKQDLEDSGTAKNKETESKRAELEKQLAEALTRKKELEDSGTAKNKDIAAEKAKVAALGAQITELKQPITISISPVEKHIKDADTQIKALKAEIEMLKTAPGRVVKFEPAQEYLDSLKKELSETQAINKDLKAKIERLQTAPGGVYLTGVQNYITKSEKKIQELESEIARLKATTGGARQTRRRKIPASHRRSRRQRK
jgi:peptidoglycan hydrolase CwlO-like protein